MLYSELTSGDQYRDSKARTWQIQKAMQANAPTFTPHPVIIMKAGDLRQTVWMEDFADFVRNKSLIKIA